MLSKRIFCPFLIVEPVLKEQKKRQRRRPSSRRRKLGPSLLSGTELREGGNNKYPKMNNLLSSFRALFGLLTKDVWKESGQRFFEKFFPLRRTLVAAAAVAIVAAGGISTWNISEATAAATTDAQVIVSSPRAAKLVWSRMIYRSHIDIYIFLKKRGEPSEREIGRARFIGAQEKASVFNTWRIGMFLPGLSILFYFFAVKTPNNFKTAARRNWAP